MKSHFRRETAAHRAVQWKWSEQWRAQLTVRSVRAIAEQLDRRAGQQTGEIHGYVDALERPIRIACATDARCLVHCNTEAEQHIHMNRE